MRYLLILAMAGLTGCFSLSRDEPVQQHFVLGGSASQPREAGTMQLDSMDIGLRPLLLAEYLATPLIIVRQGPHEISYSEFFRWGEGLDEGANRAVAGYLAAMGAFRSVDVAPWAPRTKHDYLIQLHIQRFEGEAPADTAATTGTAFVQASWEILLQPGGAVMARGTTNHRADWTVGDYAGLVGHLDAGLRALSDDLVATLDGLARP